MVSVSVRYLFYQPITEKIKTWSLRFPTKENPYMETALFNWPIVLQYHLKAKYRLIFRKFFGWIFFQPSFRLISRKLSRARFVSVRQTSQIALLPFVCSFCIVRAFSFQGHTKTLYRKDQYATCRVCSSQPTLIIKCAFFRHFRNGKEAGLC